MIKFTTKIKVEFYDVDAMGIVYHGNYAKFLEKARCEFLNYLNYDYMDMKKDGYVFPIIKMDFKFIKPIQFKDEILIICNLVEFQSQLKFKYTILNAKTKEKLSLAHTAQACVKIGSTNLEFQTCQGLQDAVLKVIKCKNS